MIINNVLRHVIKQFYSAGESRSLPYMNTKMLDSNATIKQGNLDFYSTATIIQFNQIVLLLSIN